MSHSVVWFEVMGKDGAQLHAFYRELFGWKIEGDNPMKYGMVEAEKARGIPGGVGEPMGEKTPHSGVTFYVSTEDITRSLDRAKALGGKVLLPRTEMPGGPTLAFFSDPSGNAIGLVEE
jgi:predicted enzyme related to lactoylglutathione lyase